MESFRFLLNVLKIHSIFLREIEINSIHIYFSHLIFIIIDEKTFELHRNEITEKHNINSIDPNEHKGTDVYPSLFYYLK